MTRDQAIQHATDYAVRAYEESTDREAQLAHATTSLAFSALADQLPHPRTGSGGK